MRIALALMIIVLLASGCTSPDNEGTAAQANESIPDTVADTPQHDNEVHGIQEPLQESLNFHGEGWHCGSFKVNGDMVSSSPYVLKEAAMDAGFSFIGMLINFSADEASQQLGVCDFLTDSGFLCIPAQLWGSDGNLVVIGLREALPGNISIEGAINQAHRNGAVVYITRPMSDSNETSWKRWDITTWDGLAVVSPMIQRRQNDQEAIAKWHNLLNNGHVKYAFGETDIREFSNTYGLRNMLDSSYMCLHADGNLTEDSVKESLLSGRFYVTNGPIINFTVNGIMMGGEINASYGDDVEIYLDVSSMSVFNTVRVIRNGIVIQEIGKSLNRFTTNLSSTVVSDTWFSVEIWGIDTTPEYHDFVHGISNPVWVRV